MENREPIITPYWKMPKEQKYTVHKTGKNGSTENIEVFVLIKPMLDEVTAFPDEMPAVDENDTLYLTNEQFLFVKKVIPAFVCLYGDDPAPIFNLIAEEYGQGKNGADQALNIIRRLRISLTNDMKALKMDGALSAWMRSAQTVQSEKYQVAVSINNPQASVLADVMRMYVEIMLGKLQPIFDTYDSNEDVFDNTQNSELCKDIHWSGQYGMKEARDLLYPQISDCEWADGYETIWNPLVVENAKRAYQLAFALEQMFLNSPTETRKR